MRIEINAFAVRGLELPAYCIPAADETVIGAISRSVIRRNRAASSSVARAGRGADYRDYQITLMRRDDSVIGSCVCRIRA